MAMTDKLDISQIIEKFKNGQRVIVFDDLDRENEADIIVPIAKATPDDITFMVTHAKGLLCTAISRQIAMDRGFPLMATNKADPFATAFGLSVDSRSAKTGISPRERCQTAKDMIDPSKTLKDFVTPGHLFPCIAKEGLLLQRRGHTEAAVSLCRWAGLPEGALICEMVKDDGNMLSIDEAKDFAAKHDMPFCTVEELVEYQKMTYSNVERIAKAKLATEYGEFDISIYKEAYTDKEHVFLSMGDYTKGLVRVHSECLTGDVFASRRCDCGSQLHRSLARISEEGRGAIVYLRQEGRGIGLGEKIKAYYLQQNEHLDTVDANIQLGHKEDERDYHQAAWILKEEGFTSVRLYTNNPDKIDYLQRHGLNVTVEKLPAEINPENVEYLKTKKARMGHEFMDL